MNDVPNSKFKTPLLQQLFPAGFKITASSPGSGVQTYQAWDCFT